VVLTFRYLTVLIPPKAPSRVPLGWRPPGGPYGTEIVTWNSMMNCGQAMPGVQMGEPPERMVACPGATAVTSHSS
jgi:hypothetical protein